MKYAPTLADIDHTPPTGESVSNVWNRGTDGDGPVYL
jgi:hypothetical protein